MKMTAVLQRGFFLQPLKTKMHSTLFDVPLFIKVSFSGPHFTDFLKESISANLNNTHLKLAKIEMD